MHAALYPLLAVILFATNAILPQIGIIVSVFSPLVLLFYFSHQSRSIQTDVFFAVMLVGLAVFNDVLAGFFVISPLFSALFVRYTMKNRIQETWLPAAGAAALSFLVMFSVIYGLESYRNGLVEFTVNALKVFMNAAAETNAPMTQSPYYAYIQENMNQTALSLVLIFPAFNYMYTVLSAFISMRLFAKIKNIPYVPFRMPDNLVWILIASFGLIFTPLYFGRFIGINLALGFLTLYAFQGAEVLVYWMNRLNFLPIIRAVIFIFLFSEPPIILGISLIGLFSVWFNFYGKPPEEEQEKSE